MNDATTLAGRLHDALELWRAGAGTRRQPTAADAFREAPPVPWQPFLDVALAALDRRASEIIERGDVDPLCTVRQLERPHPFTAKVETLLSTGRPGGVGHPPSLADLGCLLLAGGLLEVDDLAREAELASPRTAQCFGRAIVQRHLADGELEAAEEAAAHPRLAGVEHIGWRVLGDHHARRGDAEAFLALWSRYEVTVEKSWIREARRTLVEQVSRRHGWRAGLEAAHRPRISTAGISSELRRVALGPLAETVREPELVQLLATAPELADLEELDRLDLRVRSVLAHAEDRAERTDHPALRPLLDELLALDPTLSRDLMRARDGMLARLWPVIGTAETLAQLRRGLRGPALRREMTVLSDDIEPPQG